MTDRLDDLLFSIGEEQNGRVDFDQMYADLLQKQKEEETKRNTRRSRFVRYSAMAACAVALVGIGAAMINSSRFKAEAPAEAAMTEECVEESAPAAEGAAQEAPMMAAAADTASPPISASGERSDQHSAAGESADDMTDGGKDKKAPSGAAEMESQTAEAAAEDQKAEKQENGSGPVIIGGAAALGALMAAGLIGRKGKK
ncbi:MAG: hypothetical protein ACI4N0_05370 [Christensenellales bacterium]